MFYCTNGYHLIICIFYWNLMNITAYVSKNSVDEIKHCFTDMNVQNGDQSENYLELKAELDKNCTHIQGDVVIRGIATKENGSEPNLNFLRSIKEIRGCLLIKNTNVSLIPFTNLVVIRGECRRSHNSFNSNSFEIVTNSLISEKPLKTIFDFRNLRSIVNGHIRVSPSTCKQLANINSGELFEDIQSQRFRGNCSQPYFNCSSKCPLKHGKRYCWGPSPLQCQIFSKCVQANCPNRCYISKSGNEVCCNDQCLGGCTSYSNESCFACSSVLNGKICQRKCSSKKEYNKTAKAFTNNKSNKVTLFNSCHDTCPDGFYDEEGICTSQCTIKNYEIKGKKCRPCQEYCEQKCVMEDLFTLKERSTKQISMDARRLRMLANCTTFRGSIFFNENSFRHSYLPNHEPIVNASEFWNLSNLRKVTGNIYMDFRFLNFDLNNLSFFKNLQVIEGNENYIPNSLAILNSKIYFIGLRNLRSIGLKGHNLKAIMIQNNSNLCYFDSSKFKRFLKLNSTLKISYSNNKRGCSTEGKICSSQCDNAYGCWGSGATYCHKCAKRKLGDLCADNCTSVPGYYQNKSSVNEIVCIKCHDECANSCSGQRSDECIGGCKNAMEGMNCVPQCSRTHYLNKKTMKCEICNQDCHPRNLTRLPVCSGPSPVPGPGGCSKCQAFILDRSDEIVKCTNNQNQIDMFNENLPNMIDSPFSVFIEKFTDLIITYKPCHPLCSKCTFDTAQRIKAAFISDAWNGCVHCKGYWHQNVCLMKCPKNLTFIRNDQSSSSKGECPLCHSQCHGCSGIGNDKCFKCSNFRVYDTLNRSKFICVDSCPMSYKDKFFDERLNETICLKVLLSKLELVMVIIVTVIVLIIITFLFIILRLCSSRNDKRRKNKINAYFSNANEEDSNNFIQANMSKLPIIRAENLEYDSFSDPLGKGAFGTVYFGKWKPTEFDFDDNTSINSCKHEKVEVAIKLVNQSCTVNEFMEEVKIMASVRHKHCLRLIGLCYRENNPLLITSFIHFGSMDKYLKNNKAKLTGKILLLWAEQIADGMVYLERNHIIHRDLATRNVLINKIDYVQITDFGLSKVLTSELIDIRIPTGVVPVRWLAIESLRDGTFSHKSDVWAYAVTLWEIFTFAQTPYHPIKADGIREEIIKGTRLCQPEICSLEIYILMLKCWSVDPSDRPSFEYIWDEFKTYCNKPNIYLSYPDNNNNESSPSKRNDRRNNNMNNNYLQLKERKNVDTNELSRDSMETSPSDTMIIKSSHSDMKIPSNIIPLLSGQPTRNNLYQPADEFCNPLLQSNQDRCNHLIPDWPNNFAVPQCDHHGQQDTLNMTEYMEPRNIRHDAIEEWL